MNTSKYTISLEYDQVDAIITKELKAMYDGFAPEKRPVCGIWHNDLEEDLKEMKKMRKALARVLDWMGVKV
jgi:hypothetical protein